MADPVQFPEKLQFLFEPFRYKVVYGGRGKGASWGLARALLVLGANRTLRIMCAREIQESIDQSVYALLVDQIKGMGLESFYSIQKTEITGRNGTQFNFHGLRHKIDSIKSAEGIDICWVSEARLVSKDSWNKLVPTIRKDGSEIWVDFNPELDTDETYKRFVLTPPESARVVKMSWRDNPWFPEVLRKELEHLKAIDPDDYLHVYEGHCKQTLTGAVYADELRAAASGDRICKVPYYPSKGVHVFADLGWSDYLSLWFVQKVGMEYRVLLSYQNRHKLWDHYLKYIQDSGFLIDTVWLPFDGANGSAIGKSIEQQTRDAGRKCRIVPKLGVVDGINAVRTMFPSMWFDAEGCADGLQALRRYVWEESDKGIATRQPKHDDASHYADAMRYLAVGFSEPVAPDERAAKIIGKLKRQVTLDMPLGQSGAWMG